MNNVQQGWQCPVCKRVYAPWVSSCDKCGRDEAKDNTTFRAVTAPATINGITIGETWVDTYRKCEKCGGDMQVNVDFICNSMPPQDEYRCKRCGNIECHVRETHL